MVVYVVENDKQIVVSLVESLALSVDEYGDSGKHPKNRKGQVIQQIN